MSTITIVLFRNALPRSLVELNTIIISSKNIQLFYVAYYNKDLIDKYNRKSSNIFLPFNMDSSKVFDLLYISISTSLTLFDNIE